MVPAIAQVEPLTTSRALRGPFDYRLPQELRGGVVNVGSMLVVPFARRQVLGVVVGLAEESEVAEEKLLAPLRALELGVPVELVALAEWIAAEYCSTLARALTLVLPPGAARRLSGRKRRTFVRSEQLPVGARRPEPPPLTPAQAQALEVLVAALQARRFERRLLQGVTGSGKTEIYLRAATVALQQGRGAIVLVPEIALTPQIVGRFRERFGETVAVIHSRLRPGERYEEWRRLRTGEARVCVGPRSAVFAPVGDLGLVVVDEEHDSSYKHEGDPRYDARDVALHRARSSGALLLLGSATPRPESVCHTGEPRRGADGEPHPAAGGESHPGGGGEPILRLPERVDGRALPDVTVLDMRGATSGLHPLTAQALADVRTAGGKAIVLLNRRGWSNFLSCRSCGTVWSCPHCDVALVLHGREGFLSCHHCGHREPVPQRCDQCGSISVSRHGAGTERMQHDLASTLDGDGRFPIFRLDADTVGGEPDRDRAAGTGRDESATGSVATVLRGFEAADSGALIGTQMVAKGHDFPDVSLGVVLDADATLRFPDFRADERTFALIAQLAGRAGRGTSGRVLVQTIAPDARAIAYAARHDSDGFLASELERRQALRYPPFSHLIRITCAAPESANALAAASAVAERLSATTGPSVSVLGPAALFRLRGQERQVLVVKAPERRPAVRAVGEAVQGLAQAKEHKGVSFAVDVDPQ